MPNRLINEQSPYLLQHAHNPVDWYPWGDEAFERAKKENKPVIVSIGYAACHWCHVMEHESFENEETAAFMNEHFINIKVDREEHPDVDHMYMDAVQAITQSGGWPLNVFVTPERVPFYGGTYYPPRPLYGRPSWVQVMQQIYDVWTKQNDEVAAQSKQMLKYLHQLSVVALKHEQNWTADACRKAADNMLGTADTVYGGFGGAPKFPAAMSIIYLLEHYHFTGYEPALQHALKSLDAMAAGGIYDQLGGGFARYSTDVRWLAPHFEKMLYDNALLVMAYTEAYRVTKEEKYKQVVRETIDFVNRELQSPEGGFYCALDADSEGEEGKYYTFTWEEWLEITGGNPPAERYFGVTEKGNWEGTNILHETISIPMLAKEYSLDEAEITLLINEVKNTLLEARKQRTRPATDDKCLLSWNAMMNMALSRAGVVLEDELYIQQAQQHMKWMKHSYHKDSSWMHTWKAGVARIDAKLDDYAYLIAAMLQLASVSGDNGLVFKANELMKTTEEGFLHENKSFFYFSSVHQKDIPVRKTDLYDGSVPSANSIMASNLVLLGMLMERSDWIEQGQYMLRQMQEPACRYPTSYASWAISGQKMAAGFKTVVLAGVSADEAVRQLRAIHYPDAYFFIAGKAGYDVPLLAGKYSTGAVKVHICDTESCKLPVREMSLVAEMLKNKL